MHTVAKVISQPLDTRLTARSGDLCGGDRQVKQRRLAGVTTPRAPRRERPVPCGAEPAPHAPASHAHEAHASGRTDNPRFILLATLLCAATTIVASSGLPSSLPSDSEMMVAGHGTLHRGGEFVRSNQGTPIGPDGSTTVRFMAHRDGTAARGLPAPADSPVTFYVD